DQGATPYHLRDCAYWGSFDEPKIVTGNLNLRAAYSMVEPGTVINAPSTMLTPASKSLLGVLNSKLADHYIRKLGVTRNGGYFEYKPMFIKHLPVPQLEDTNHPELVGLVTRRIEECDPVTQLELENKIDSLVFALYGLNEAEIELVEAE